jgi:hypothetical protein
MKRTLILTLCVLAVALAVCWASQAALNGAVEEAERLQSLAVLAVQEKNFSEAKSLVVRLAEHWERRGGMMEMLASHDALHDVDAALGEAQICLECEDHDDFLRTMSTVRAGLEHLKDEQALSFMNLY